MGRLTMGDFDLFQRALGLEEPLLVVGSEFDVAARQVGKAK